MTNHDDVQPFARGSGADRAPSHSPLSEQAVRRKHEMLGELQVMVRRQGRRRRVARAAMPIGAAASLVLVIAITARIMGTNQSPPDPAERDSSRIAEADPRLMPPIPGPAPSDESGNGIVADTHIPGGPSSPVYTSIRLVTARATPSITVRKVGTSKETQLVRTIDDDELIAVLAQTGRHCGLVRTKARTSVVCNSCDPGETIFDPPEPKGETIPTVPNAGVM